MQLQPLVDALAAELLKHDVLHAEETPLAMLKPANLRDGKTIRQDKAKPIAIGRSNGLFAGSLRAGKRAAAVMSLVHSARINGLDPYAYLRDVLERLPLHPAGRIAELLPHRRQPAVAPA